MILLLGILKIVGVLLFVLVFFGLCIFVHELGHLLVALWRGLYVEKFSIGFGRKIWGTRYKGVDYVVSMLPFGGYVALPQLEPSEEPQDSEGRPLPRPKPMDRILTALAGPAANILFGFFLGLFIWWFGIYRPHSETLHVYEVPETIAAEKVKGAESVEDNEIPNPEYEAGLRPGDEIIEVNGEGFDEGWQQVAERIALSVGEVSLTVLRDGERKTITYTPAKNLEVEGLGFPFFDVREPVAVRNVVPGSPAAKAGLQEGDRVVALNGESPKNTPSFIEAVRETGGEPMTITVERDGETVKLGPFKAEKAESGSASEEPVYRIGAMLDAPLTLVHPSPWEQFVAVMSRTGRTLNSLFASDSLVKPRHMSGPVGIVQMLWIKVAHGGIREGLSFIILVTFSLAVLNLLPIPVLDGGHIVFAALEGVTRRRIPASVAHFLQTVFAVLLIGFMLYVTFWDIGRLRRIIEIFSDKDKPPAEAPAD